jgi:hypothetical protein
VPHAKRKAKKAKAKPDFKYTCLQGVASAAPFCIFITVKTNSKKQQSPALCNLVPMVPQLYPKPFEGQKAYLALSLIKRLT